MTRAEALVYSRAAIQAYLRAEAAKDRHTFQMRAQLRELAAELDPAPAETAELEPSPMTESRIEKLRELVNAQAEDDGLWFIAQTAPEAYLQQELRKLHAAIENAPRDAENRDLERKVRTLEAEIRVLMRLADAPDELGAAAHKIAGLEDQLAEARAAERKICAAELENSATVIAGQIVLSDDPDAAQRAVDLILACASALRDPGAACEPSKPSYTIAEATDASGMRVLDMTFASGKTVRFIPTDPRSAYFNDDRDPGS